MPPDSPLPSGGVGASDRLIGITLALEEALAREAWDEADDLFAARDALFLHLPAHAVPREVDDIDVRILARLQRGQAEVRRQSLALAEGRRAMTAYAGRASKGYARAV